MALLKYQDESGAMQAVHVGADRPEVVIGRVRSCDLVTKNSTVSRRHASVRWQDGAFVLSDLGSANGLFYKKQRIDRNVLCDGDSFMAGSLLVSFELEDSDRDRTVSGTVAADEFVKEDPDIPEAVEKPDKPADRPRKVPAAWKADWKPSGGVAGSSAPKASEPLPQVPRPRIPSVFTAPHGDTAARIAELEEELELERQDRAQFEQALSVAQERYYEVAQRADRADQDLVDIRSEIDLTAQENQEMAVRADELERENAELLQEIDDLRRDATERGEGHVFDSGRSGSTEIEALKEEKGRIELELKAVRDTVADMRSKNTSASGPDLESARRTIEDLKLSNKGYLKRISRLIEELDKKATDEPSVSPEVMGLADRLNELSEDADDTAVVVRSLVAGELKVCSTAPETASEIRTALTSVVETVKDIRTVSGGLRSLLRPPVKD